MNMQSVHPHRVARWLSKYVCLGAILAPSLYSTIEASPTGIELEVIGGIKIGSFDQSDAEISAFDPSTTQLFVTQATGSVAVIDLANPQFPVQIDTLTVGHVNSVAVKNGILAIAIESNPTQDPGSILFYNTSDLTAPLNTLTVGSLPDMLVFSPDGTKLLVANEGEPNADYSVDPEGTISIISLGDGNVSTVMALDASSITIINFNAYDSQRAHLKNKGIRIFGPNASVSQDLEPEYIAITEDSTVAYVTLQENNAVAIIDLTTNELVDLVALGNKNHFKGLPSMEVFEIAESNLPVIGTSTADDVTPVKMGGFSGLWYSASESNTDTAIFYTHGDRGPNGDSFTENGVTSREFLLPDYQATIIKLAMNRTSGDITVDSTIPLFRIDGTTPISGLPNIPGWDEQPLDGKGNPLSHDPLGGDMEGIVMAPDGTFWMVDEYRPAIYHFSASGTLNARYVPQGTSLLGDNTQNPGFYGSETLPAEYALRSSNRGFEAVAYDTDKNLVYAFIQSPMYNPDSSTKNKSDVIRILGIDPIDGTPVEEYVYLLENNTVPGAGLSRVDKIGDAVYAGNGRFYVLERDSTTPNDGNRGKKFVFEIDLTGATDLLSGSAPALNTGLTLEQHSAEDLASIGIVPVYKTKILNLPSLGYLPSDKAEGLALLENGSLAVINDNDFTTAGFPTLALGLITFTGGRIDASDKDDSIHFGNYPVWGTYMPDAIATYTTASGTYFITANEGDAREYEGTPGYIGNKRIKDLVLDPTAFPNAADLQKNDQIGRLSAMVSEGDLDNDGDYDRLWIYGTRSFSIWDTFGNLVWDSNEDLEQITSGYFPNNFNSSDGNDSFDNRSDDKGPEPEGVTTGTIDGRTYAFVGLERIGGIMVYDVTEPTAPVFIQYINNRDFDAPDEFAGDIAPEGIIFISAEDSPSGKPLLVVSNEVSATITIYGIYAPLPTGAYTINILHNNDGESQLIDAGSGMEDYGGIARFVSLARDRQRMGHANHWGVITLSSGDNFLAGPEFNASLATLSGTSPVFYDALGLSNIGYDAIILGNHDFDFGPQVLAGFIGEVDAAIPYLSANLDFTNEASLATLVSNERIASRTTFTVETAAGTKTVSVIGATTPNLPFISSPGKVQVMSQVADIVQSEINAIRDSSDLVVFVSHLQGIEEDFDLIKNLSGIDIAIAGGGDELLANSSDLLLPGDVANSNMPYPMMANDKTGKGVPIVTTPGSYRYLGNLVIDFANDGSVLGIGGQPLPVANRSTGISVGVDPDPETQSEVVDPVIAYVAALDQHVIATTDVPLDGRRNAIRSVETSIGNLVADSMLWAAQRNASDFGLSQVDIALVGGGGIRNDSIINASAASGANFTELDTFDILPFSNFVAVVPGITAEQLKDQLETTFSQTAVRDGTVVPQGDGTGRFAQIAGLTVVYDPTAQAQRLDGLGNQIIEGLRVISATLDDGTILIENGKPVASAPAVNIAVTNFHAAGGDQWFWFLENTAYVTVGLTYQQALANYVQADTVEGGLGGQITDAQYGPGTIGNRIIEPRDSLVYEWAPIEVLGWQVSNWMGALYTNAFNDTNASSWVYQPLLGWIYLHNTTSDSNLVWHWGAEHGWFYTRKGLFPWVYGAESKEWYYLQLESHGTFTGQIIRSSDNATVDALK